MKHLKGAVYACLVLTLAACGDGGHLSVGHPGGRGIHETHTLDFAPGQPVEYRLPFRVSGGIPPYESIIEGCPGWVTLFPDQGVLAGTAPVADSGKTFFCTYRVTESDPGFRPQRSVTYGLRLSAGTSATDLSLPRPGRFGLSVGTFHSAVLPAAAGGVRPYRYALTCVGGALPAGMGFGPETLTFSGTPEAPFRDSCTYSVTDSSVLATTVSRAVEVEVAGPVIGTLSLPASVVPGNVLRLRVDERARVTFREATGGVEPYTYGLHCSNRPPAQVPGPVILPTGLGFGHLTRVLSGTPGAAYRGPDCTYWVTDSATPPATLARSVALIVEPGRVKWRFSEEDRSLTQEDKMLNRNNDADPQVVYELPDATPEDGTPPPNTRPVYQLSENQGPLLDSDSRPLGFNAATRELEYVHGTDGPQLGRTSTYRYQVLFGDTVDDTLCVDVSFRKEEDNDEDEGNDPLFASVRIHDNAFWDGEKYRCPPVPLQPASASRAAPSNPVHEALGPVHARRALDIAHGAVRDRVRGWTPGAPRVLAAITPQVGIGSLSGENDGFDYTGSSESVSTGAEIGAGSWQAGLVGSYTRTELHYRADAGLAERGYRSGEHDTEILSLHPFAAWHMPSGGNVWTSFGAGAGRLRHRDDLGFPSWSRSDVQLRAYAAGASIPVADILSGEIEAEAGIESFAFEIEGGGRISSSLPTLRGRDWRAGLTWSAPVRGVPSLSVAYKHLTGDGPEGGQLEAKGSISVDGILDPRLSLISNVEGAFGIGDHEHSSWGLSGGVRFAPGETRRGLGLELDTRLASPDGGGSADLGMRGEAGYGMRGWPLFPTVRPFVGLVRYSGDGALRRSLGIDLRDTPGSRVRVEAYDRPRDRLRAIRFSLRHRF